MDEADLRLDGNAAAGMLTELFAFEVTTARTICASCGAESPIAALTAFGLPMGVILRCPGCDAAVIRVGRHPTGAWLDLRGARAIQVPILG